MKSSDTWAGWSHDSWVIHDHQFLLKGKVLTSSPQLPYWDIRHWQALYSKIDLSVCTLSQLPSPTKGRIPKKSQEHVIIVYTVFRGKIKIVDLFNNIMAINCFLSVCLCVWSADTGDVCLSGENITSQPISHKILLDITLKFYSVSHKNVTQYHMRISLHIKAFLGNIF